MKPFGGRGRSRSAQLAEEHPLPTHGAGDELVGYRLLRVLGSGSRATVFLGHALRASDDSGAPSTALKVFHPGTPAESIQNELVALSHADDEHVVHLDDIGSAPNGLPVLVLERLRNGSLSHLIARRGTLEAGEAVTLLAPLGETIARLHSRGICHGQLGARSVMFRASGAPVLSGFGAAQILPASREVGSESWRAAITDDMVAYAHLVDGVLEAVESPGRSVRDLREWLAARESLEEIPGFTAVVSERIFSIAPARPLRFAPTAVEAGGAVPLRLAPAISGPGHAASSSAAAALKPSVPGFSVSMSSVSACSGSGRAGLAQSEPIVTQQNGGRALWSRGMAVPSWLGSSIEEALESAPFRALGIRVKKSLARVRRPVWIVGGGAALAVLLLGAMLPQYDAGNEAGSNDERSSIAPTPVTSAPPSAGETAIAGDDPVAAAEVLVETRERCFDELSVLCLDAVFQQGSAALADARRNMRSVHDGAELGVEQRIDLGQITVVERLGDTALLSLGDVSETQPASLLLMKGEAGWRIREILDD